MLALLSLFVPSSIRAAWLELGTHFLVWDSRQVKVYRVAPAQAGEASGPARIERSRPQQVHLLSSSDELMLVRYRQRDPRPLLRRLGRVLVATGGRVVVAVDAVGRARLARLQSQDLQLQRLPENRVMIRAVAPAPRPARPRLPHAGLLEHLDEARWFADVEALAAYGTRLSRSPELEQAAAWCRDRLAALGMQAEVRPFPMYGEQVPNVVARLFPAPRGESRPILLIGGHLDSVGGWGSSAAPGADDNASGAAGVLEVARVLAKLPDDPGVEVRFLLFGGEEQGLLGSQAVVAEMQQAGELDRVVAMLNLDMIAFDQQGELDVLLESYAFNQAGLERMAALAAAHTDLVVALTTDAWGSDHVPFLRRNVPAVLAIEGEYPSNPHDHTAHDLPEHMNPALAGGILRLVTAYALDLLEPAEPATEEPAPIHARR